MYEQFNFFDYVQSEEHTGEMISNYKIKNKVRLIELFAG
jgi:hypothetical protein